VTADLATMLRNPKNEAEVLARSGRLGKVDERVTTPWWATMLAICTESLQEVSCARFRSMAYSAQEI